MDEGIDEASLQAMRALLAADLHRPGTTPAERFALATQVREFQDRDARFAASEPDRDYALVLAELQIEHASAAGNGSTTQLDNPSNIVTCDACSEDFECVVESAMPTHIHVPCNHVYCGPCIRKLHEDACKDELFFPARCCRQNVEPSTSLDTILGQGLVDLVKEKKEEFATPNRIYCSTQTCSAFIPPASIALGRAVCPTCRAHTCILCKAPYHWGACQQSTADAELEEVAKKEGWKTCRCGRIIELTLGCNHMTCKCGHEFCYVCNAVWKTCRCEQWDEARLTEDANEQAREEEPRAAPYVRQRRARGIAQQIRAQHQCPHDGYFTRVARNTEGNRNNTRCNMCRDVMKEFILSCDNCRMHLCRRCQRNRLR